MEMDTRVKPENETETRHRHGKILPAVDSEIITNDDDSAPSEVDFKLRREVGLMGAMSLIIGNIIGSGIFLSPKGVVEGVGSVGLSLILWTLCGVISMVGGFGLVELGTCIHKSGGDYMYVMEAYGGLVGFLYAWLSILFMRPASASIMAMTCAEYILEPFFGELCSSDEVRSLVTKILAAIVILTLLGINVYSVKLANRMSIVFMFAKVAALGIIIIAGAVLMIQGHTENLTNAFEGSNTGVSRLALGFYSGMWAYDGWNNLNYSVEEIKNPVKTLPRAIVIAVPMCTIIYVLVNVSYFTVLSPADIIASPAVALTWARIAMPSVYWLFPIFVGISTFGSAHTTIFASGRTGFVAAREGHVPYLFSFVDVANYTPSAAIIFTCLMSVVLIFPANITQLINYFSFTSWIWYCAVAVGVLVLRWKQPDLERPYRVPLVFPIVTALVAGFLVIGPLVQDPQIEFLYATLTILAGLIFYFPLVYFKKSVPGTATVTKWMQLMLQVAAVKTEEEEEEEEEDCKSLDITQTRF